MKLTPRQLQIFNLIADANEATGKGPTLDELKDVVGCTKQSIYCVVLELQSKGVVTRDRTWRSLRVVKPDEVRERIHRGSV